MKTVARWAVRALTAFIPLVIAACYGPPGRYRYDGKVKDRESGEGIKGIQVTCVMAEGEESAMPTQQDGHFYIHVDSLCRTLRADDVDGADNGLYLSREVVPGEEGAPSAPDGSTEELGLTVIELTRVH